ncbi:MULTISPECIES: hypothetical protein [unclassified Tychonema]|nr:MULTISPECIES: hypothetical protein [unclassified Tychonema]
MLLATSASFRPIDPTSGVCNSQTLCPQGLEQPAHPGAIDRS